MPSGCLGGPPLLFVLMASLTFLGITRILCESGLAATRAQLITPTVVRSFFGTQVLGAPGTIGVLSFGQVWMSDVRTFVMAAAANGLKLTESIRNKGLVLGSMILAVVLSLGVSVWTTLYYAYESGANNANTWFFLNGPRYTVDFAASYLRDPAGPDYSGLGLMALGGAVMTALYWIRSHLLTFPIHPIGFAVSQMMLTRHIWFQCLFSVAIQGRADALRRPPGCSRPCGLFFSGLSSVSSPLSLFG